MFLNITCQKLLTKNIMFIMNGGMVMPRSTKVNNDYMSNGITIKPAVPTAGENLTVMYDGLLSKSGASHVYAHVGFDRDWKHVYDYPMKRTSIGFEATIPVMEADTLNICFKDCANNWDNNSGANYTFDISK